MASMRPVVIRSGRHSTAYPWSPIRVPTPVPPPRDGALAASPCRPPCALTPRPGRGRRWLGLREHGERLPRRRGPRAGGATTRLIDQIAVERGRQIAEARRARPRLRLPHAGASPRRASAGEASARSSPTTAAATSRRFGDAVVQLDHPPQHHARRLHPRQRQPRAGGRPLVRRHGLREALQRARLRADHQRLHRLGGSTFIDDIEWLVEQEITDWLRARPRFCPRCPVDARARWRASSSAPSTSRRRATTTSSTTTSRRTSRRSTASRQADVTVGCAGVRYCPTTYVSRGQMASFLDRALDLPRRPRGLLQRRQRLHPRGRHQPPRRGRHHERLRRLAASAPARSVSREQMAAFLHRASLDADDPARLPVESAAT